MIGNKSNSSSGPEAEESAEIAFEIYSHMGCYVSESKNDFMLLHMYRAIMYSMPLYITQADVAVCALC